ncbi:unnamed protein product [Tilletia controversa]|uniref:Uncharacterized protein n=3 Tax=Tilletia TaxID=13289 RepID=A0A8X7MUW0_9BASI|nr:hypothetical protein CF336_g3404 [Tilletia laevis]KAE8200122.1 hypothetical protein CF328_g3054 [Tilletia controversa]KAE8262158.1 hypothetical protein A4X03_0g2673 [Tilletia caries]KAE8203176.1 hypothetical protein CF335_g3130 [Tilletia laevis]KAE8248254.1 hypothetical protein A4X06_0g3853 [Tilletia controversa]
MKFTHLIILIAVIATPIMGAMNCPDGTSPGTDYCRSCGCYCASGDNRVHCDPNTTCYSTSGSAQAMCMNQCTC